jgi:hypothetical protein
VSDKEEEIKELLKTPEFCGIRKFYRYRSMEARELEGIFTERKIFLPRPIDFNDPFECRPCLTIHTSGLKRQLYIRERVRANIPPDDKKLRKSFRKFYDQKLRSHPELIENAHQHFLETTGLYCLSEKNNDILMWSHYTLGHRGVRLEFDAVIDAAFNNAILFGRAMMVNYSDERPVVNVMEFGNPKEYQKMLLTKSKHWEYEKEWRIIQTELEGGPGMRLFPPQLLTGVIFGALISPEDKKKVMGWISTYPTRINLFEAKINKTRYQLDIEPLNLTP